MATTSVAKERSKEYIRQARMRALGEARDNGNVDARLKEDDKIFKWLTQSVK